MWVYDHILYNILYMINTYILYLYYIYIYETDDIFFSYYLYMFIRLLPCWWWYLFVLPLSVGDELERRLNKGWGWIISSIVFGVYPQKSFMDDVFHFITSCLPLCILINILRSKLYWTIIIAHVWFFNNHLVLNRLKMKVKFSLLKKTTKTFTRKTYYCVLKLKI